MTGGFWVLREVETFVKGILAGEGAVFLSATINNATLKRFGLWVMAGLVAPLVEEVTKTGLAEVLRGNVLMSHVAFGSHEGFLYATETGEIRQFDHRRPLLHASFGTLYLVGRRFGGNPAAGLMASILAHVAWNQIALIRSGVGVGENILPVSGGAKREITLGDVKRSLLI